MINVKLSFRFIAAMSRFVARAAPLNARDAWTLHAFDGAQENEEKTKKFRCCVRALACPPPPGPAAAGVSSAAL